MNLPNIITSGRYLMLDLETTGLSTKNDQPVQIAFAHIDYGQTGLRGYYTVKPSCPISEGAAKVHGYTMEKLSMSPTFPYIAHDLHQLLGDRVVLGFNVLRFDIPMLQTMFSNVILEGADCDPGTPVTDVYPSDAYRDHSLYWEPKALDVIKWERHLSKKMGIEGKHNLAVCVERWGVPPETQHDAWHDCRLTWGVFCQLATRFPHEFGDLSVEQALAQQESL